MTKFVILAVIITVIGFASWVWSDSTKFPRNWLWLASALLLCGGWFTAAILLWHVNFRFPITKPLSILCVAVGILCLVAVCVEAIDRFGHRSHTAGY